MRKFKTLIVDDDEGTIEYLKKLLNKHIDTLGDIQEALSFSDAVEILTREKFDLSILDNKLDRHKTVFDLIRLVGRERCGIVVYTSDAREIDIENMLDLLPDLRFYKPYDDDSTLEFIVRLKLHLKGIEERRNHFIMFDNRGMSIKMDYEDIFYVSNSGTNSKFFCKDDVLPYKDYLKDKNIGEHKYLLDSGVFVKCRSGCFLNKSYIKEIRRETAEIFFDKYHLVPPVQYASWFAKWLNDNGY
jgi:DNA-binding LytR/AlgR family response regulator